MRRVHGGVRAVIVALVVAGDPIAFRVASPGVEKRLGGDTLDWLCPQQSEIVTEVKLSLRKGESSANHVFKSWGVFRAGGAELAAGYSALSAEEAPLSAQHAGVFFLSGIPVQNEHSVSVDWGGATPVGVHFVLNGSDTFISGSSASKTYNMGSDFITSISLGANTLEIYAEGQDPETGETLYSETWSSHPVVLPIPSWSTSLGAFGFTGSLYELNAEYPVPHFEAQTSSTLPSWLPIVGGHRLGVSESYASMGLKFSLSGTGQISLSGQTGFTAAGQSVGGQIQGTGSFGYTASEGLTWSDANFNLTISGNFTTPQVGVLTAIPCLAPLADFPGLSQINDFVSVWANISPQLILDATLINSGGQIVFDHGEATGQLSLKINAQGGTETTNLTVYGGGNISVTLQVPAPYLKNVVVGIVIGAEASIWGIPVWPPFLPHEFEKSWTLYGGGGSPPFRMPLAGLDASLALRPTNRAHLGDAAYNRFVPGQTKEEAILATATAADGKLVENVFPYGEPAIAALGSKLIVVWIYDDPSDADFQNTEIQYSYFDGKEWSTPALIADDTRLEKKPQLQFDSSGKAVCVWERIKETNFTGTELEEMFPVSEIVYSVYDPSAAAWSAVAAITDNNIFDHSPALRRAPSGDLVLVWEQNAANLLIGNNSDLPTTASALWLSEWDGASWSSPVKAPVQLIGVPSWSMDCTDGKVMVAYMQDLDGDLSTATDNEIFLLCYDGSSWSAPSRLTNDAVADVMPDIIYDSSGEWLATWNRDGFLVARGEKDFLPSTIADTETARFVPRELVRNAAGHIILYWLQQRDEYPDIYYVARDCASGIWSSVRHLTQNDSLECYFAPVAAGNDVLAVYLSRQTVYQTRQLEVNGEWITVEGIPSPGQTDLCLITHHMNADLAVAADDISITGQVVPGGNVTIEATIHNVGDISARNVPIGFYLNDPTKDENLIGTVQTIIGPLEAGASDKAQLAWKLPDTQSSQVIYAVIDPKLTLDEANRTNNRASVSVLHPELVLAQPEISMGLNGDVVIVAPLSNTGQIQSPGFTVVCYDLLDNEKEVASVVTGSLVAGDKRNVLLRIPDWTMEVGSQLKTYRIEADPDHLVAEKNTDNNVGFVSIVIADIDSDGIPEFWELDHGTSDKNALDAVLDPDDDDLTNLQEFKNRTNPRSADTDSDGMPDGWEVAVGLDPTSNDAERDSDGDGLSNLREMGLGTNPLRADTDGDGVDDGTELLHGTVPTDPNSVFKILKVSIGPEGKPVLSWRSIPGKNHSIFATSDLTGGWGPPKKTLSADPSGLNAWTDDEGQVMRLRFYRLDISDAP